MAYLLIAVGGALGSVARYWCSMVVASAVNSVLPWGTILVNIVGSLLIGGAMGATEPGGRWQISDELRTFVNQFFMIGVLGGFTTFSSFSLQTLNLLRAQQWLEAGLNVVLSLVLCLFAVWIGYIVAITPNR
jgi:fluoride exporter